jgi:hypothetical protein
MWTMEKYMYENEENNLPPTDFTGEIESLQKDFRIVRDRNLNSLANCKNPLRRQKGKSRMALGKKAGAIDVSSASEPAKASDQAGPCAEK